MNRIKVRRPDVVLRLIRVAKVFLFFFSTPPPPPPQQSLVITISVMADLGPCPARVFCNRPWRGERMGWTRVPPFFPPEMDVRLNLSGKPLFINRSRTCWRCGGRQSLGDKCRVFRIFRSPFSTPFHSDGHGYLSPAARHLCFSFLFRLSVAPTTTRNNSSIKSDMLSVRSIFFLHFQTVNFKVKSSLSCRQTFGYK